MRLATFLLYPLFLITIAHGHPEHGDSLTRRAKSDFNSTCHRIAAAVSSFSDVYFPPTPEYLSDISHVYVSSSEVSACSVEPGCAEDVSKILCILASTRTPFAVKGGGHATNPKFSSTKGVQISMTRFNETKVSSDAATVEVGPGLTWDRVYAVLESYNLTVVGGRVPGVGVAGLSLGGGMSWMTSQYGLAIDNVAAYELVLPNGTIKLVTQDDADLWFGLRGGLNNFGIVTKFILRSHPQGRIWGGYLFYPSTQLDTVKDAIIKFQDNKDTKASMVLSLSYSSGTLVAIAGLFYDAPTPPQGIFNDFLAIPAIQSNTSSRSFYDLVASLAFGNPPSNVPTRLVTGHVPVFDSNNNTKLMRHFHSTYYSGVPVTQYSAAVFDAFVNQINLWGGLLGQLDKNLSIGANMEPLDRGMFTHGSGSAYPPDRSRALFPSVVTYAWSNSSLDNTIANAIRNHSEALHNAALADGQNVSHAAIYVNYALFDTPLEEIYGANVPRLRKIRADIDPEDVMGLAGGFKF